MSLKNILMLTLILLSTMPILIVGFISLQSHNINIENEITNKNQLLTKSISGDLERFLNDSISFLKQIAYVVENKNLVIEENLNNYLSSIINNYTYFDMIRILDINGQVVNLAPFDENINELDMSFQKYFTEPITTKNIYWSKTFISSQTSNPTLTVSLPFKNGVVVGHLNLSGLMKIVENINFGSSGFASIIDSDGTIIAHPNKIFVHERMNVGNRYNILKNLSKKNNTFEYDFMGERRISSVIIIPQTKWIIEVSQKKDEAFSSIKSGRIIIITGTIISILIAVLIGFITLQKVLRSLQQLTFDSQRFARGDYTHKPHFSPYSEINNLINSFKTMSEAVKNRENELKNHRDHLEEIVKRRTAELESANKDLESFNYSISHDLRAPLRAMEGFSKVLSEDYSNKLDEDGIDYLNRIIGASQKMSDLVNNILKLSRITRQEINIKRFNLSNMIRKISIDLMDSEKDRNIEFIIAENINVYGDESLIEIAMQNILSNAVKYTSKVKEAIIEFGVKKIKGIKTFYIKDNGAGFDMSYKDDLFIPFKRLHSNNDFSGTGVGLSIVNRIILKHGGNIWAESKKGEGAAFYFALGKKKQ